MDGNSRMRQKRMICVVGKVEKTHRQEVHLLTRGEVKDKSIGEESLKVKVEILKTCNIGS